MSVSEMIAEIILELMLGSVWGRQPFVDRLRTYLLGAFGEYLCREISIKIGEKDYWSNEVKRVLRQITDVMNSSKTVFNTREKALAEAMDDALVACGAESVFMKNKMINNYYTPRFQEIKQLEFDEEQEFRNMIKEFLPQYFHLMKD